VTLPAEPARQRDRRQALLRRLVAAGPVASQSELVTLLRAEGVEATQATVSRDLDDLGITKRRDADGRIAYALPETLGLATLLRQFHVTVDASGNLAVVRAIPGAAGAVANAIDLAGVPGVLATVQGDDTVLVVAAEGTTGRQVADHLLALAARYRTPDPSTGSWPDPSTGSWPAPAAPAAGPTPAAPAAGPDQEPTP
jgi:transcriptional regulator of arginine metabolism